MNNQPFRRLRHNANTGLAALILALITPHLNAAVTPTHLFRLGDNDPGVVSDGVVIQGTDGVGAPALQAISNPLFSSDIAESAARHTVSRFSMNLDGGSQALWQLDSIPTPNANFGLELWVKPHQLPDGFSLVVYNGDTRLNGWGIYQNGNTFGVSYGGLERFGSATAEVDQWVHLALVNDGGVSTFYVNGAPAGESHAAPIEPQGGFAIGAHPQPPLGEHFSGWVDEVRLFTFDPGTFTPEDLLLRQRALTLDPSSITASGALLNGTVLPEGGSAQVWFEISTGNGAPQTTPVQLVPQAQDSVSVNATITSLLPSTLYHYHLVTSNALQVSRGIDVLFRTRPAVTSLEDDGPGTLRQAIREAAPSETIYWMTEGTIHLTNSSLELTQSISVVSDNPRTHILDGGSALRLIVVRPGATVTLVGLTLQNGRAPDGVIRGGDILGGATANPGEGGGAILNQGEVSLRRCILKGNRSGNGAGFGNSSALDGGNGGGGGPGGAIYSEGNLSLDFCLLQGNEAGIGGGGAKKLRIGGIGTLYGFAGGNGGPGGAIFNHGSAHIRNTSFISNFAGNGGSGGPAGSEISGIFAGPGGVGGDGGAFFNDGTLEILQSTLSLNSAGIGGPEWNGVPDREKGGHGGAVVNAGGTALLTLTACTVVSNSPALFSENGAILNGASHAAVTLRSCLIGGNGLNGAAPDLNGLFATAGFNIISIASSLPTGSSESMISDHVGTTEKPIDLHLEPLTRLTDLCQAHPLTLSSPAVEAGDDALLSQPLGLTTDQAGNSRRAGPHLDAGALEFTGSVPTPVATTLEATLLNDPDAVTGTRRVILHGLVNPAGPSSRLYFELGLTPAYGGFFVASSSESGFQNIQATQTIAGLAPGFTYHYRVALSNAVGVTLGADRTFTFPTSLIPGDRDGDGKISGAELQEVLNRYWSNSSWLRMTNVAGLSQPVVTFDLPDTMASPMSVESTTDFMSWQIVGPALPRFEFTDTNAPSSTPRFYRLRSN